MRESSGAGCGGVGSQREVPGRKKKGKEKVKEPGWGKIRTLFNGHKEKNGPEGKAEERCGWRKMRTRRGHLEENGL